MMYNKLVEDCFFQPRHIGVIDSTEPLVGYFRVSQQSPVIIIDSYLQCSSSGLMTKVCFKARGNPYIIAGMEWLCCQMEGMNLMKPIAMNYQYIVEQLAIPKHQYPIALLIEDVYKEGLALMKKKIERSSS